MSIKKARIFLDSAQDASSLQFLQNQEELFSLMEQEYGVRIVQRGTELQILGQGKEVQKAKKALQQLVVLGRTDLPISPQEMQKVVHLQTPRAPSLHVSEPVLQDDFFGDVLLYTTRGKRIGAKTDGQRHYMESLKKNDLVFAIGPAGTGKTYIAVAFACLALKNREVSRIILTRPAVEAGEKLGFLPGDIQQKVDPYFRPLYDALFDMMDVEKFQRFLERGIIEIAPLAFMRGRTLNDAFIILDEAQNTTSEQMKMFLTRLGFSSRAVVTGDITQTDLPYGKHSGLAEVERILQEIPGIEFVRLSDADIVRHELVQKIIQAYERHSMKKEEK